MERASHLTKASDCERVLGTLDITDAAARCWVVIVKFYAALHYVDAYFAQQRYEDAITVTEDDAARADRYFTVVRQGMRAALQLGN